MELQFAERINQLEPYALAERWQQAQKNNVSGHEVLNLAIGNPEEGPDSEVLNTLSEAVTFSNRHGYQSYQGTSMLIDSWRRWLGKHLNLHPEQQQLMVTQGAREAIHLVSMALLNPGDIVLGPDPGYPLYKTIAEMYGAEYISYNLLEENYWQPGAEQLKTLDAGRIKLMWLNSPHMPTGKVLKKPILDEIKEWARQNKVFLVNDNPYAVVRNSSPSSIFSDMESEKNLIEIFSLSKSHQMAGWRMGAIAAHEQVIDTLLSIKTFTGAGAFLPFQEAAAEALNQDVLQGTSLSEKMKAKARNMKYAFSLLGCQQIESDAGMFLWVRCPEEFASGDHFAHYLMNVMGIFVAPGQLFGKNGDKYVRVSLGVKEEKLREVLRRVLFSRQKVEM